MLALALASAWFYARQNGGTTLGGEISPPKLLWLDYALTAWFLVPFAFWRATGLAPWLRRIYGAHLASFTLRGLLELWLLYGVHAWIPPYGITHDLATILLITFLLRRPPADRRALSRADRVALGFLTSVRIGLTCEMLFAWLFYQAVHGRTSETWFAANGPEWMLINSLTWAAVIPGYLDLARVLWGARDVLFPALGARAAEASYG
jgi:hypothetical protein